MWSLVAAGSDFVQLQCNGVRFVSRWLELRGGRFLEVSNVLFLWKMQSGTSILVALRRVAGWSLLGGVANKGFTVCVCMCVCMCVCVVHTPTAYSLKIALGQHRNPLSWDSCNLVCILCI